ncbi:epidermal patterning factor-like protein [Musa troglodytarum]|uniref:Epidermal patterning factor-like protein n=1 Tax=Musa troglodytarum TaxID=320322 RepID=A0A9E7KNC7_9LILI|nr:epidermal patterning factor-like protein [Musa troglodytarum]
MLILRRQCRLLSAAFGLLFFAAAALGVVFVGIDQEVEERPLGSPEQQHWERLVGPGSSPPSCRARCGRCFPCQPVRVMIQPGQSVLQDYKPEAWRSRCGNKLFVP